MKNQPTSVRLSDDANRWMAELSRKLGISQTAIIELASSEKAKREGVKR